jgi:hypothetical protein
MNNSNVKVQVQASYDKRLNFTATGVLLIWVLIIILGIFSLINASLLLKETLIEPFIGLVLFGWVFSSSDLYLYLYLCCIAVVYIIGFFTSRSISISLMNLFKDRRWIEPSRFIKGVLLQLVTASIASILTVVFFKAINFTEFFSLFFSFEFLFSLVFLAFCLYYYRGNFPEPQIYRNQRYTRF